MASTSAALARSVGGNGVSEAASGPDEEARAALQADLDCSIAVIGALIDEIDRKSEVEPMRVMFLQVCMCVSVCARARLRACVCALHIPGRPVCFAVLSLGQLPRLAVRVEMAVMYLHEFEHVCPYIRT